jgi:hypothetical protein
MLREHGHADAGAELQGASAMLDGLAELVLHQRGQAHGLRGVVRVARQNQELVAAEARGGVVGAGSCTRRCAISISALSPAA